MIIIENDQLKVTISTLGAEVQLLQDKVSGREYLWQGDRRYWKKRSPVLFPITGGLWNATTRIGETAYQIPKHGFVSQVQWQVIAQSPESVTMIYYAEKRHAHIYPYDYEVSVRYSLRGRRLETEFNVRNTGKEVMFFQMGGHPGFSLPHFDPENEVDGYLRLEGDVHSVLRAGAQGCIEIDDELVQHRDVAGNLLPSLKAVKRYPITKTKEGFVPLNVSTFINEALIFDEQISGVTLLDCHKKPFVAVESSAPVWLFWAPQGVHSPFVCCEPWYGLPDLQGFNGKIHERAYIQKAEPNDDWKGSYAVTLF